MDNLIENLNNKEIEVLRKNLLKNNDNKNVVIDLLIYIIKNMNQKGNTKRKSNKLTKSMINSIIISKLQKPYNPFEFVKLVSNSICSQTQLRMI